jgi:glucose/arabinose dehydrogenase
MKSFSVGCALVVCCSPLAVIGQTLSDPGLEVTTVLSSADGLSQPTALSFLGSSPSDFFVTEKATGKVKHFVNGVGTTVLDLPVTSESERGLLGMTLSPNFGQTGQPGSDNVYLYYSRSDTNSDNPNGGWQENRLSIFTWDGTALTNERAVATFGRSDDGRTGGPNHNGGPITFGSDGKLYGITGDLNRKLAEQNYQSADGKSARVGGIYRLNADGSVPTDNPFSSNPDSGIKRWYSYGTRNSFGLTFDPATGRLWDTENGPTSYDEINLVLRGSNSGWTDIMGPNSRSPGDTGGLVNLGPAARYSNPEFSFKDPVAVTAINFLYGSSLGAAYDDKVLVGDANNGNLYMFTLNDDRSGFVLSGGLNDMVADSTGERNALRVGTGFGITTDIVRGPDGDTYVLNLATGELYRIEAAGGGSLASVPEPETFGLALFGMVALTIARFNSRRNKSLTAENSCGPQDVGYGDRNLVLVPAGGK